MWYPLVPRVVALVPCVVALVPGWGACLGHVDAVLVLRGELQEGDVLLGQAGDGRPDEGGDGVRVAQAPEEGLVLHGPVGLQVDLAGDERERWVLGVLHRVLGVQHRVQGVLHRALGVPHRVLGEPHKALGVLHRVLGVHRVLK